MATVSSINSSEIGREVRCGGRKAEEKEEKTICQLVKPSGRAQHLLWAESGYTHKTGGQETGPDNEAMPEAVSSSMEKEETEDHKFKASTGNLVRSCLKINRQTQPSLQSQGKYKTPARVF